MRTYISFLYANHKYANLSIIGSQVAMGSWPSPHDITGKLCTKTGVATGMRTFQAPNSAPARGSNFLSERATPMAVRLKAS